MTNLSWLVTSWSARSRSRSKSARCPAERCCSVASSASSCSILALSVATTFVTGWPRGDLAGNGLCRSSSRSIATRALPSLACERGRRLRLTMARAPSDEILRRSPICA